MYFVSFIHKINIRGNHDYVRAKICKILPSVRSFIVNLDTVEEYDTIVCDWLVDKLCNWSTHDHKFHEKTISWHFFESLGGLLQNGTQVN